MRVLRAGAVTAGYDNGFLRRISYGEKEVVRMIYFALRDHNWNTVSMQIENENVAVDDNHFRISYDCFHRNGGVTVMEWNALIRGAADGTIIFEINGTAIEEFRKNRAGFCILHPLAVTGAECRMIHGDNTETVGVFPTEVSPDNPFRNMRSMKWNIADVPFELVFEGDLFEMEDQRNWGDASFKTFCTPLEIPFPALLRKGQKIFQRVTLKPVKNLAPVNADREYVTLTNGAESRLPLLGIAASTEQADISDSQLAHLRALGLKHYRVDLYPSHDNWVTYFSKQCEHAFALRLPLEVALHLTANAEEEIESFSVLCQQNRVKLKKVLLLPVTGLVTSAEAIAQIPRLRKALPGIAFGAGTNHNFNEINKNHFTADKVDYICFSIDPQEHAFDDLTILENIGAQQDLVRSTKAIYGQGMSVHISPLALLKRFNPYATNPEDFFIDELRKADPRQRETLCAVWTFGSICALAEGKAEAITLFQTIGKQGVLSAEDELYPVYYAIKTFSPYQGKPARILHSSDPLVIRGIILDGKVLALVNLTQDKRSVRYGDTEYTLAPWEIRLNALHSS